jgi:hypothetical protein
MYQAPWFFNLWLISLNDFPLLDRPLWLLAVAVY